MSLAKLKKSKFERKLKKKKFLFKGDLYLHIEKNGIDFKSVKKNDLIFIKSFEIQ